MENALVLVNSLKPQINRILEGQSKLCIPLDKLDVTRIEYPSHGGVFAHVLYVGPANGGLFREVMGTSTIKFQIVCTDLRFSLDRYCVQKSL